MSVISFTDILNARRAATKAAERQQAEVQANQEEIRAAQEPFKDRPLARAIVGALVAGQQQARKVAEAHQPMPAYSDPRNEFRGSKYEATKRLRPAEIAARMREDIKAAQKAGTINKGVKVSVRTETYSMGFSIDITVTALPAGFRVLNPAYAAWVAENGRDPLAPFSPRGQRSEEWAALSEKLEAIHNAYQRDNSDSMSDYSDRRFYGDVKVGYDLFDRMRADEVQAAREQIGATDDVG